MGDLRGDNILFWSTDITSRIPHGGGLPGPTGLAGKKYRGNPLGGGGGHLMKWGNRSILLKNIRKIFLSIPFFFSLRLLRPSLLSPLLPSASPPLFFLLPSPFSVFTSPFSLLSSLFPPFPFPFSLLTSSFSLLPIQSPVPSPVPSSVPSPVPSPILVCCHPLLMVSIGFIKIDPLIPVPTTLRFSLDSTFKGTQDWEFFWLRFWNLHYFFVIYVKILRFYQEIFLIGPFLGEVRFFRVVLGLRGMKKNFELGQKIFLSFFNYEP